MITTIGTEMENIKKKQSKQLEIKNILHEINSLDEINDGFDIQNSEPEEIKKKKKIQVKAQREKRIFLNENKISCQFQGM